MLLYPESELAADFEMAVEHYRQRLKQLRVGRAKAETFEEIPVSPRSYGGMSMPLKSLATISIENALSILIQPFDRNITEDIAKAIQTADLGYNPMSDGTKVRINIPPLTEETRKQAVKDLHAMLEEAKVTIRQIRHKYIQLVEEQEGVSEDDQKHSKEVIQKSVDATNGSLEELSDKKEEELMSI